MKFNFKQFGLGGLLGFVLCAFVAYMAFSKNGSFSLGPMNAEFSASEANNVERIKFLEKELNRSRSQTSELERKLAHLKASTKDTAEVLFEGEVLEFNQIYGSMKISGVNLSCDTEEANQYRKAMRHLKILEAKAGSLGVYEQYLDFFSDFQGGIVTYSTEC